MRVLAARPAEAERSHAHAALGDLLEEALDDVSDELPTPRLRALRVALLLEEPDPGRSSQRDVGIATRSAIELLADRGPLAIAIDDEQWLDGSSAAALRFAVRRLTAPVRLLVSRRAGSGGWVDGTLADEAVVHRAVRHGEVDRRDVRRLRGGDVPHRRRRRDHRLGRQGALEVLAAYHRGQGSGHGRQPADGSGLGLAAADSDASVPGSSVGPERHRGCGRLDVPGFSSGRTTSR